MSWRGVNCLAYLDDVIIYSDGTRAEHRKLVKAIVTALGEGGLQLDIEKSEFEAASIKYLGFIIKAGKGIRVDPEKVAAIRDWEPPTSVKGIRSFLGFANFYRTFIPKYSEIASPLTKLTRKGQPFAWAAEQQESFDQLQNALMNAPLLAKWDSTLPTMVETNSSRYVVGAALTQRQKMD